MIENTSRVVGGSPPRFQFTRPSLPRLIIAALVCGAIFGALLPAPASALGGAARLFVRLLQLLVAPLVFSTLAVGIARTARASSLRRLGLGAVIYFILAPLVAVLLGLAAGNLVQFALPVMPETSQPPLLPQAEGTLFIDTLVPTSIIGAMAANNLLGVVFFTVMFALALRSLRDETGAPLIQFLEALAAVMLKLTASVMWVAPIGVFAAVAAAVANTGWSRLLAFLALLVVCYVALLVFGAVLLVVSSRVGRFSAIAFLRATGGAILLAFSTASSAAALPGAIEALERWGASRRATAFLLPLGFSFNLTGTALYLPLGVLFWAGLNGVPLNWASQLKLGLSVFFLIRGLPPIPRGLFLVLGGILAQFGLPPEGVVIMLGIDPLLDMARTGVNLGGNCLMTATLTRFDLDRAEVRTDQR